MEAILNIVKRILPKRIRRFLGKSKVKLCGEEYALKSYSQEGEDIILREIFNYKEKGFYVDVGAHHPKRFSNTYHFYKHNWRGINIDPKIGMKQQFDKIRSRDINLEIGIADHKGEAEFYVFDEPALSTFSKAVAVERDKNSQYIVKQLKKVTVDRLENILESHCASIKIDLMNIDVEGLEWEVVKSNNWHKFRPKILLIEMDSFDWKGILNNQIHVFLVEHSYEIFAKTPRTAFYRDILQN